MSQENNEDKFDKAYRERRNIFGDTPSEELSKFLSEYPRKGKALDLGCGDGRDTLALLRSGLEVTAIDRSPYAIKTLLSSRQLTAEMEANLSTVVADIRTWQWPVRQFDVIVATTILDHIEQDELPPTIRHIVSAAKDDAVIFVEVHTIDDPAVTGIGPVSEFASEIRHYFGWNELLDALRPYTRVLLYTEKTEWDYDHGPPHMHGVATFLGILKDGGRWK